MDEFVNTSPFALTDPYTDPVPHLLAALVSPDTDTRLIAARFFRRLPSARAVPILIQILHDEEDEGVLAEAIETLGFLRAESAVPALLGMASHSDSLIRANIAEALGYIAHTTPAVTRTLLTLLADTDAFVRFYAAEALGDVGDAKIALPAIIERQYSDPSPLVRLWCAYARASLGDIYDWPALKLALTDTDTLVRQHAVNVLRQLVTDDNASRVAELIRSVLEDETDYRTRERIEAMLELLERAIRWQ